MSRILNIVAWPFVKVFNLTKGLNDAIQSPTIIGNAANNGITYVTKLTGVTSGAVGMGKGTADALEALACQDGVCFIVSCVGISADGLQCIASFVPGPNVTVLLTTPISWGCKVFVYCCKHSKLPWRSCF
jgi:hypothetical protein